jgi:hypothetical protein
MLFSLAVALMVILVAVFWVYQGFFSATLMFFECTIAAMVAFGFYESVHGLWASALGEGLGHPLALMLLFLATLLILRLLTDKLIKGNVRMPVILDRVGGGIGGFLSGMVLVGMALIGIQMLPITSDVFGYERVLVAGDGTITHKSIVFKPDEFTMGLMNLLSNGRFGDENPLAKSKPDFMMDLYGARACTQTEDRQTVPGDSLAVVSYWETHDISSVKQAIENNVLTRTFEPGQPGPNHKLIVCHVRVMSSAAGENSTDIRFRLPQFRLVGPPPEGLREAAVYLADGSSDIYTHSEHNYPELKPGQKSRLVRFNPETQFILSPTITKSISEKGGGGYQFDVAFEVPEDFKPWYLAFKRGARVDLTTMKMLTTPPQYASTATGSGEQRVAAEEPKVGTAPAGTTHVANILNARVSDELIVALDDTEPAVKKALQGGHFGDCHFFVELGDGEKGVKKLETPEGKKIVQLDASKVYAASMFGQAVNLAANVTQQNYITTEDGTQIFPVGRWQAAKMGNKVYFELQYHPEAEMPERCLEKAKKVRNNDLRDSPEKDKKFGFIFVVDPGVTIKKFTSGKSSQDLNVKVPKD